MADDTHHLSYQGIPAVRNFNSKTLKVNDVEGNPVEIAAVVVFKVVDSARAVLMWTIMKSL